ncbi:hypothetical protein GmHk_15G043643 [Glycine max]|nr:hypothetical protein GmHk_15G043643 [Glycine max]
MSFGSMVNGVYPWVESPSFELSVGLLGATSFPNAPSTFDAGVSMSLLSESISSEDPRPLLNLQLHFTALFPFSSTMWTLNSSPPMCTFTVCWIMGVHGVLMSTLALSNLRSSSTSLSTSTNSPIVVTIFWICSKSQAINEMPQH